MASIVNIPFNFQPTTSAVTSASYTVPSGKYAKVYLLNCQGPILNGVNLYYTTTIPNVTWTGSTNGATSPTYSIVNGVTKFNASLSNTYNSSYARFYLYFNSVLIVSYTSNTTINLALPLGTGYTYQLAISSAYTNTLLQNIYFGSNSISEIWVKSGDVITFAGGVIKYEEYNNIS